jgi:hypothetical protein
MALPAWTASLAPSLFVTRSDLLEQEYLGVVPLPLVERVVRNSGAHRLDAGAPCRFVRPARRAHESAAAHVAQHEALDEARRPAPAAPKRCIEAIRSSAAPGLGVWIDRWTIIAHLLLGPS